MSLLAKLSMKNRALIALITIVVAVFGGLALTGLKQELAPSVEFPQLSIVSSYPGASPDIVNDEVSTPIETAIQGVTGLESTTTTSSTGSSIVSATFTYGTDLAFAEQKLLSAVNRIQQNLPDDVDPQVLALSLDDIPIIQLAVAGSEDESALSDELKRTTVGALEDIDGVREAALVGDLGQRVVITPDDAELAARGLTAQAIRDALQQNGVLIPAGEITEDDRTLAVQIGDKLGSVDDIAGLPLPGATADAGSGAPVDPANPAVPTEAAEAPASTHIGDVADVELDDNPRTSISRVNGEAALAISITKLPAANTVEVSHAVQELLPELQAGLDSTNPGAEFTIVFDQAPYIEQSIEALATEGLLGLAFAVLVILVFLLSVRATIVTAISIPTSLLITFIGLQFAEYTLNILTLGALTISIGRVVDDSIVVIENIKRHLVEGVDKAATIVRAVREVAAAITAATVTTVAVFLPLAFVEGITGELFRPFALTVTLALAASLLVSLTIVPVLAYWFLKPAKVPAADAGAASFAAETDTEGGPDELEHPSRLQRGYLPVIRWTLKHGVVTIVVAVLVLGGTVALAPFMKTNFLGSSGQNTFQVTQTLPVGTSLDALDDASTAVEAEIRDTDGVETVQTSIGGGGIMALFGGGGNRIDYSVTTDEGADQDALQAGLRGRLDDIDDAGEIVLAASSGFGTSNDVEIEISASNQADLEDAANAVLDEVRGLDSVEQATTNLSESRPYLGIVVDRDAAAAVGLSEVALGTIVSQAMQPQQAGSVVIDETTLTVYVAGSEPPPVTVDEVRALQVPTPAGPMRLDELADVEETDGPATITTQQGLRSATVTATPGVDDLGTATAEIQSAVDAAALPAGTSASLGGVAADQSDAFSQLGLALLAAILIVYIVMVATFKSLLQPVLLLVSVPFAATGAILLQIATGIPLGVASLVGVLMLIGIVVTNAIVLVDLVNQYRTRGMTVHDAVVHGTSRRLRPILMTALATIFALLPMALGITGHGGFISQPLALVVIGGLVSSTVLTLIVLPVLYALVEAARERRRTR
ncbi:efflux RND transporter permease subunit [Agromyces archimandritae]|uniref:Efflux RND transporter permease subunit n=1 Tax=Agromyces archimandritae TaxID=2781962 RepID=A0A975FPM0_9MICO|nr:efflux RND transporter permease subunit [Agromyces archimandritae]QTX05786.1 efflux RND transporter permease subunit [Agromyces archimandritae]